MSEDKDAQDKTVEAEARAAQEQLMKFLAWQKTDAAEGSDSFERSLLALAAKTQSQIIELYMRAKAITMYSHETEDPSVVVIASELSGSLRSVRAAFHEAIDDYLSERRAVAAVHAGQALAEMMRQAPKSNGGNHGN